MVFRRLMVSRQSMVSVPPQRGRLGGGWCHRTGNYSLYWCLSKKRSAISTRKSTEILIKSKEKNQKWNTDSTDFTRIGLSQIHFFDNISSVIFGFCFGFSRICKCCSTSSSGCLFSALFSCSPWAIVGISVRYSLPNGHVLGGIYAQVGQRACPCWVTCLPMLGTLLAQKCIVFGLKGTGLLPKRYWFTN